jgi:hypothetical protein
VWEVIPITDSEKKAIKYFIHCVTDSENAILKDAALANTLWLYIEIVCRLHVSKTVLTKQKIAVLI